MDNLEPYEIDDYDFLKCPYFKTHHLQSTSKYNTHVIKCEANFAKKGNSVVHTCPFNAAHKFVQHSRFSFHVPRCRDHPQRNLYYYYKPDTGETLNFEAFGFEKRQIEHFPCKFNQKHLIMKEGFQRHYSNCIDSFPGKSLPLKRSFPSDTCQVEVTYGTRVLKFKAEHPIEETQLEFSHFENEDGSLQQLEHQFLGGLQMPSSAADVTKVKNFSGEFDRSSGGGVKLGVLKNKKDSSMLIITKSNYKSFFGKFENSSKRNLFGLYKVFGKLEKPQKLEEFDYFKLPEKLKPEPKLDKVTQENSHLKEEIQQLKQEILKLRTKEAEQKEVIHRLSSFNSIEKKGFEIEIDNYKQETQQLKLKIETQSKEIKQLLEAKEDLEITNEKLNRDLKARPPAKAECVVCLRHEVDTVCVPCGHMCYCAICLAEDSVGLNQNVEERLYTSCSICNHSVERIIKVFKV